MCVCVCVCVRACVRACVRTCVCVCACVRAYQCHTHAYTQNIGLHVCLVCMHGCDSDMAMQGSQ